MSNITIEELSPTLFGLQSPFHVFGKPRVAILTYNGDGDPVMELDEKIKEYTKGKEYREFIDMNMDNPRVRVIIFGEL